MSSESILIEPQLRQPAQALRRQIQPGLFALIAVLAAAGLMVWGYRWTGRPISITIDGQTTHVRTHQTTVGQLLENQSIVLRPEDIL